MKLTTFISSLLTDGKITVEGSYTPVDNAETETATRLLEDFYRQDRLEMPFTAPAFDDKAALWAATHLYTAVQLTIDRAAEEIMIKEKLKPFEGPMTPEAIYSADLVLRQLPVLLNLVKGLAPADILLQELISTATSWPFSSVGYALDTVMNEEIIFSHPSLKMEYTDRIIRAKDKKRVSSQPVKENIHTIAGDHLEMIWPGL